MCGICGFTGDSYPSVIRRMTNAIRHRGPDDCGFLETKEITLGMRRLAIVDLETGQQPVFNEDQSIAVVFNGEIYNHLELREALQRAGHHFRTHHSDTEILVHLYEQEGDAFLKKLNGMFAIALWDQKRKRLLLARDRLGIKPLYFITNHIRLIFGSEIKALLNHPEVGRQPNYQALYHYFSFKNIPAPWSAFSNIEQLEPGEYAVYENGQLYRETWWHPSFIENESANEDDASCRILELLEDSVRLQMQSDVPFGAYLSGGLDSSAVVALMSKISSNRVKTFSLVYADNFPNKAADQHYAMLVAKQFDTDHHEYVLTREEVVRDIDAVIDAFDEPFSGVTSTYFLTRMIGQHVRVALSGDGADELFGSYLAHRLAQPLDALYRFQRLPLFCHTKSLAELDTYHFSYEYLVRLLARGDEAARRMGLYIFDDAEKSELLSEKMLSLSGNNNTLDLIRKLYATSGTSDPLNRALYCDLRSLLPDQVLAFVDRLSMAHSVEVRPPFLDHRLVEYVATLPGRFKILGNNCKYILKNAVRDLLPKEVIERPKEGFVLPIDYWLLNDLREWVKSFLQPNRLVRHGLLRQDKVNALLDAHYAGTANHGPRIWNLVMFQRWWEKYYD